LNLLATQPRNHISASVFSHIDPVSRTLLWKSLYCGGLLVRCQNIKNAALNKVISVVSYSCIIRLEQSIRFPCKQTLSYFDKTGYVSRIIVRQKRKVPSYV
jgi:hypothetical protein